MSLFLIACSSSSSKKIIIAHRGAPSIVPEHTLVGVGIAHTWGVDYIEADLVLSKDNQLVVLHDIYIDTVTNVAVLFPKRARADGRFYAIDFTLKELKQLEVNERIDLKTGKRVYPNRFNVGKSNFKIPTFQEFIDLIKEMNRVKNSEVGIYPEIKAPEFHLKENKDITKAVFQVLDKNGYNNENAKIFVQSFYPKSLERLKYEFNAKFPLILLLGENSWKISSADYNELKTKIGLAKYKSIISGVGPYIPQVVSIEGNTFKSTGLAEKIQALGLVIHPYTHRLGDGRLLKFLFDDLRVDGIFSDFGNIALEYSR